MESRLPKPTGLKKPTIVAKIPSDRIKAAAAHLPRAGYPLTRDISNLTTTTAKIVRRPQGSPELNRKPVVNRGKLRRSRSACDIRDIAFSRPLKRTDTTLAPIPSKTFKSSAGSSSASNLFASTSATLRNGPPGNRGKAPIDNSVRSQDLTNSRKAGTGAVTKIITKRIPPYDYKARFNDLLEKHKSLKEKFDDAKEQLATFDNLPEQYEESQNELIQVKDELKNSQTEIECLKRQTNAQNVKICSLTKSLSSIEEEFSKITKNYEIQCKENASMMAELNELRERSAHLLELTTTQSDELETCAEQLFRANMERKELHNAVMDLRGNIRVFCRVRPRLDHEIDRTLCEWTYLDDNTIEIQNLELLASGAKNKGVSHGFSFDQVFHPKSSQDDVFEMVSPLIQSALDGFNVCIFAYGQTGSGKTYTMDGISENVGIIPRTVDLLFESVRNYKRLGWEYTIKATFLEIYNEVLYDLLSNEQKDMEIRMSKNKTDIYVSNITEETVETANRLRHLMNVARLNRATAATASNERSSRSHAVTRIELIGQQQQKGEISIGTINLVDLAGSESPKTSIRMNETKNINRSLSELTNVILALLQKQDHIPYRNSKLTHLLMPSLGGNSKTLMFINVAPFQDCFGESVKSLRFAASVNSCKSTKAKKNKFLNTSNNSLMSNI